MKTIVRILMWIAAPAMPLICRGLGRVLYYFFPFRRGVIRMQVAKTIGRTLSRRAVREIVKANYVHYACFFFESLWLAALSPRDKPFFARAFRLVNADALRRALAQKKGAFLIGLHIGFWEAMGPVLSLYVGPITVVVKKLRNPLIRRVREKMQRFPGVTLLDKSGDRERARALLKAIHRGEMVGVVHDQHRPSEGFAPFFGFEARTNATAAVLSRRTGAPVFLAYVVREKFGRYEARFLETTPPPMENLDPAAAVRALNGYYNGMIEKIIEEHPEQWLWAHRRFKDNPEFAY